MRNTDMLVVKPLGSLVSGNGRGAVVGSHGNGGRPPGGAAIGLGVGLTTAGIKGSDVNTKFAGKKI